MWYAELRRGKRGGAHTYVFALEEAGHGEEDGCGLLCAEHLALVDEVQDLCEHEAAPPGLDRRRIEDARILHHRRLLQVGKRVAVPCDGVRWAAKMVRRIISQERRSEQGCVRAQSVRRRSRYGRSMEKGRWA